MMDYNYIYIRPAYIEEHMMHDQALIKTFVAMYLNQCQADFSKLSQAVEDGNYTDISQLAHHIKPTMEYIGATDVRLEFQVLEDYARQQKPPEKISAFFETLQSHFRTLMTELQVYSYGLDKEL